MQRPCREAPLKQIIFLQKAAEAKAYMQYVAFESAMHHYVPMVLTDGNIMVMYASSTRISACIGALIRSWLHHFTGEADSHEQSLDAQLHPRT